MRAVSAISLHVKLSRTPGKCRAGPSLFLRGYRLRRNNVKIHNASRPVGFGGQSEIMVLNALEITDEKPGSRFSSQGLQFRSLE